MRLYNEYASKYPEITFKNIIIFITTRIWLKYCTQGSIFPQNNSILDTLSKTLIQNTMRMEKCSLSNNEYTLLCIIISAHYFKHLKFIFHSHNKTDKYKETSLFYFIFLVKEHMLTTEKCNYYPYHDFPCTQQFLLRAADVI